LYMSLHMAAPYVRRREKLRCRGKLTNRAKGELGKFKSQIP
jgi:hypothetical protein